MATIEVKGYVRRKFFNDCGLEIAEEYKRQDGSMGERKYTAWFDRAPEVEVNSAVVVTGTLSTQIEKWADRDKKPVMDKRTGEQGQSVVIKINDAQITNLSASPQYIVKEFDSTVVPF
jgi:hypothetical protein